MLVMLGDQDGPGYFDSSFHALPKYFATRDHYLCTIQNYGRAPAINLQLNFTAYYCNDKLTFPGSAIIPTIGAGDRAGVLFLNGETEDEASIAVSNRTSFTTPTNEQMGYTFPGWDEKEEYQLREILERFPTLWLGKIPVRSGWDICKKKVPGLHRFGIPLTSGQSIRFGIPLNRERSIRLQVPP
jgi:hypothetical protein